MSRPSPGFALRAAGLAVAAGTLAACSALLDWTGFTGGASDGGTDAALDAADASPLDAARDAGLDAVSVDAMGCADGATCAPPLPAGWTGPVVLYVDAADAGAPPSCPLGGPVFDGNADLVAPPASCSACSCNGGGATGCDAPVISYFSDGSCTTPQGAPEQAPTTCSASTVGARSITIAAPQPVGASCLASGGLPQMPLPSTSWGQVARACSDPVSGATCANGGACAPSPPAPFLPNVCVFQGGAGACPAGYPLGPQVFYTGVTEGRGCSPCACATTGASCSIGAGAVGVFTDINCSMLVTSFDAPSSCSTFFGPVPIQLRSTPTLASAGVCQLGGGGAPTGAATGSGATTFCCTQ